MDEGELMPEGERHALIADAMKDFASEVTRQAQAIMTMAREESTWATSHYGKALAAQIRALAVVIHAEAEAAS